MPIFKSEKEAQDTHRGYVYDTDWEGKFSPHHTGWLRSKQIIEWMPTDEPEFLGVGCNSGGLERTIMEAVPGSVAYGIDVQDILVERAQKKGVHTRYGVAEELPWKKGKFDAVIVSEVLEHVYDDSKVLKESLRVLKRSGVLIGSVPHPNSLNSLKKSIEEHQWHTRIYTEEKLRELLKDLKSLEIIGVPFQGDPEKRPQWFVFKGTKC